MKTMVNYVLETPQAIRKMISDTSNISEVLEYLINRKIDHIYVVGSGTSYSAALTCIDPLETMLHIPVYAYCAMEFVDNVKVDYTFQMSCKGYRHYETINSVLFQKRMEVFNHCHNHWPHL